MKGLPLAFAASLVGIAALAHGCGGNAFTAGSGAVDAAVEAGPLEAGQTGEAGAEAGDAASAVDSGPPWCTGHTETLCEDFDEYSSIATLLGAWPNFDQTNGGLQFDTLNAPSPPNALQVLGDDSANVLIVKSFTRTPDGGIPDAVQKVQLTFDLRINSAGPPTPLAVSAFAAIAFGTSISDGYVAMAIATGPSLAAFWVQSGSTDPDAGSFKPAIATSPFPSLGTWAGSYTLEIDYSGAFPNGCVQLYRGVAPQLASCLALPPQFAKPTILSVGLGDVSGGLGKTDHVDLEFDNVLFDVK